MRTFLHYVRIWLFIGLAVSAYGAVVASVLLYWDTVGPPVAVSLISAGVAIVTGVVALIKDVVMDAINGPRLGVRFFPYDNRDCHATTFRDRNTGSLIAKTHYFRLRIENFGWRAGEK